MSAVISRYERPLDSAETGAPPRLQRGDGAAEIAFVGRDGANRLDRLYQRTPCRVLFPAHEPGDLPIAALLTTSGGLTGGDRVRIEVTVGAGAGAVITTAAAEKVYRALGGEVAVEVNLEIGAGGWLEWLPQETILFDGARLVRRIKATLASGARLLAAETFVFGRAARGERFERGLLHEAWRLCVGDRLVWADTLRLNGDIAHLLDAPAGFGGARAVATVLLAAPDARTHLPLARELAQASAARASATVVNGVLLARFLAERAEIVRAEVTRYVAVLRHAVAGLPAVAPRLWST